MRADVAAVDGVEAVVDLHAWQICSRITVATTHVETAAETMADAEDVSKRVHGALADHGVDHATVELHRPEVDRDTHLDAHGH